MIFLLLGALPIFVFGVSIGIGIAISFVIIFLSYTNGIPLMTPIQIGVAMYLQLHKFWYKITRKSMQVHDNTSNKLQLKKLSQLPYVRVLPSTTPSISTQCWINLLFKEKRRFDTAIKQKYHPSRITRLRDNLKTGEPIFTLMRDNLCKIHIETIKHVPIHWIQYEGTSINNGLILGIHGGAFVAGMPSMQYALGAELSKLTGCAFVSVDYRLCPGTADAPITITEALDDCFDIYKHFVLNRGVDPAKTCIVGESAGGGLSLLLLQRIRDLSVGHSKDTFKLWKDYGHSSSDEAGAERTSDDVRLGMPGCCWVTSPWTDLEMNSASAMKNKDCDAILVNDEHKYFQRMAIGQIDINLNKLDDESPLSLKDKRFSPLHGEWTGLCPLYFMVGATEMLLDDTLDSAKKANDEGVDVRVDIEPFIHHTFPLFVRTVPEAKYAIVRAADFIMDHLKIC